MASLKLDYCTFVAAMKCKGFILFISLFLISYLGHAQVLIKGEIRQQSDRTLLENVNVKNIFTNKGMTVGKDGLFEIEVKKGELIEFTKVGFQTVRIRIANEKEPLYYKIVMEKAPIMLREVDIKGKPLDFKKDSIKYHETYQIVLRKEKRDEVDMRSMPLAMLSKKNRQEWAFQEMYEKWEQEKFIDYVFNDKLVSKITYLKDEELRDFMRNYRPNYQFLRTASDYEYLDYIKHCYYMYKKGNQ